MKQKIIKNSLGYDSDLYVYQDKNMFNYSVDTILLGNFLTINSKVEKILEIGTNNGALSIFISKRKNNLKIDAIEIQKKAYELAQKNLELNQIKNIHLINQDFNDFYKDHSKQQAKKYDAIVCNPPFYKIENNLQRISSNDEILIATHEVKLNLEQIILGSSKIIQQKGYLALVLPVERLIDCIFLMRKYNFEPKRLQMVHPREDKKAKFALIEARFNSGWGTKFENNIYLHPIDKNDHRYRKTVIALYKPIKVRGK
ncbi:tRNA1(Val) (adenine(37)-N6)-methyltransferase [Mycoplasma iguanae]|uniref:tRNA1(Val) (Adenine(37)-N6)-methyltransferase n=1 Tax=Mycoplasma iguanae TaxID=292461 RepID=A0ABY5R8Y0_9MOLU|nr:tRNA1(Val) (adenine(37)-N6)-methyltransferase [Mycoplasma iguanae]UVD81953.1 tRNA1(Val) (adenine(37)-N6)-methyltransferase [Mycoplasma iguanae]